MTNTGTPPGVPARGGMPKWLIILLVLLLLIVLGCCGGVTTCFFLASRTPAFLGAATQRAEQEFQRQQVRMAEEARRQIAEQANAAAGVTPAGGGNDNAGGAPAAGAANAGGGGRTIVEEFGASKLPANFPSDVPVMSGMTPSGLSSSDKLKGSGMATFSSKGAREDVASFYDKQLQEKGWKEDQNQDIMNMSIMKFSKDTRVLTVQVTPDSDNKGTMVIMTYETQK